MKYVIWVLVNLCLATSAQADESKALFTTQCASCHTASGVGNQALQAPNISGFSSAYVRRQLLNYKTQIRGGSAADSAGKMMLAVVASLSDGDIDTVSQYVATLPVATLSVASKPSSFRGRGLYSGCASCHGAQGEGYPELGAPRINQQYEGYLARQLALFRSGARGAHTADISGQQMRAMALAIASDEDVSLLVRHIRTLGQQ